MESTDSIPQQLGDFEIIRELGRGGMGVVYEARQKSLNRRVALKVLSSGLGLTTRAVMRFKREAEAAARLHHTNIVPIYFTGEENRIPYYAMELVNGPSLDQVIRMMRRGPAAVVTSSLDSTDDASTVQQHAIPAWVASTIGFATPETDIQTAVSESGSANTSSLSGSDNTHFDIVARMMSKVADALAHAHDQGVIHRDIKPSNLLLSPDGRLSVTDFGLARMLEQPGMTVSGEFMGSPRYMSPEQITAGRIPLDHRTDIYSLGATLYELLTLQPSFAGQQRDQVLSQIIHKEPSPPRAINKRIPHDLETICLKAMEKDPDRRYQTAGDLADDLRRYVNRHAISARRTGPVGQVVRWARRHRALAGALAAVLVLAVVAGLFGYQAQLSRQRLRDEQRQDALEDAISAAMSGDLDATKQAINRAEMAGVALAWRQLLNGLVALHSGQFKQAVDNLKHASDLLPDSVAARSILATAYNSAGRWQDYDRTIEELEHLSPRTMEDYLFLGEAESLLDPSLGVSTLDKALRQRDSPLARAVRGKVLSYLAHETVDSAIAKEAMNDSTVAKTLATDNPYVLLNSAMTHLIAADVFEDLERPTAAKAALEIAKNDVDAVDRHAPNNSDGLWVRILYFIHVGDETAEFREAKRRSELATTPDDSFHYMHALYRQGRFADALRVADQSRRLGDDFRLDFFGLAIWAELPDHRDKVLPAYQDYRKLYRYELSANLDFAILSLLMGRTAEAEAEAKQALREPDKLPRLRPDAFLTLLDYLSGASNEVEFLEKAKNTKVDRCEANFVVAMKQLSKGDRAGAKQHFGDAVATDMWDFWEYGVSRSFLARMNADADWPPWIDAAGSSDAEAESAGADLPPSDQ